MKLLLYCESHCSRIEYISKTTFEDLIGYDLEITDELQRFIDTDSPRIQYGTKRLDVPSFFIPQHPFILEQGIHRQNIVIKEFGQLPTFFHCPQYEADLPFDFLSMAFYLITRYEEYLPFNADEHGRFAAQQSLAYKNGFLRQPLVDQLLNNISKQLATRFKTGQPKLKTYRFLPTIDVDFAWAFLHKQQWRTLAGLAKDFFTGRFSQVANRIAVLRQQQKDPYDQFETLRHLHRSHDFNAIYFFLFGEYGTYDKNTSPQHPTMQKLVKEIARDFAIGLHPSYASNKNDHLLNKEKNDLSSVSGQSITQSRQHFLKLTFPSTYRRLIEIGLQTDYTMGYAEDVGFRASTSHPFFWYDLEKEKQTDLKVYPFQIMDVTLKNYLKLEPDEAMALCEQIIREVKAVNGTCVSIWHNSSFSNLMGWNSWKGIYDQVLTLGKAD